MTRTRGRAGLAVTIAVALSIGPAPLHGVVELAPPLDLAVVTEARLESVIVRVESRGGGVFDGGAGVAIAPGVVLTSRHLLDQRAVFATRCEHDALSIGQLIRVADADVDLALMTVRGGPLVPVPLGHVDPQPGAHLALAGYPGGGPMTVTEVIVSDYLVPDDGPPILRFRPMPEVGQSGGPLIDGSGRIVGIAYAQEEIAGVGHAVPVTSLRSAVAAVLAARAQTLVLVRGGAMAAVLLRADGKAIAKAARSVPLLPLLDALAADPEVEPAWLASDRCG